MAIFNSGFNDGRGRKKRLPLTNEKPLAIAAGVYRLKHDVVNPSCDRRSRDWHLAPTWMKGERFIVSGFNDFDDEPRHLRWEMMRAESSSPDRISPRSDTARWNLLVAAFEPAEPSLFSRFQMARVDHWSAVTVVKKLIEMGKIDMVDVEELLDRAQMRTTKEPIP
jgi:hypothetical protein